MCLGGVVKVVSVQRTFSVLEGVAHSAVASVGDGEERRLDVVPVDGGGDRGGAIVFLLTGERCHRLGRRVFGRRGREGEGVVRVVVRTAPARLPVV